MMLGKSTQLLLLVPCASVIMRSTLPPAVLTALLGGLNQFASVSGDQASHGRELGRRIRTPHQFDLWRLLGAAVTANSEPYTACNKLQSDSRTPFQSSRSQTTTLNALYGLWRPTLILQMAKPCPIGLANRSPYPAGPSNLKRTSYRPQMGTV